MWGYVSQYSAITPGEFETLSMKALLKKTQQLALSQDIKYLVDSTALSELAAWNY
jgi:hypothetical protein